MKVNSILVFGPPASGKNTISRMLTEKIEDAKYLQNHDVIDLVTSFFPFESDEAKKLTLEIRRSLFMQWATSSSGTLISTQVLDMNRENEYVKLYREFLEKITSSERQALVIILTASQKTLEKRAHNPERGRYRNVSSGKVIDFIKKNPEKEVDNYNELFPEARVIHLSTDDTSAEDCVEKILAKKRAMENSEVLAM